MEWKLLLPVIYFFLADNIYCIHAVKNAAPTNRADIEVTATARIIITDDAKHMVRYGYKPTKPSSVRRKHRRKHFKKRHRKSKAQKKHYVIGLHRRSKKLNKEKDRNIHKRRLPFNNPNPDEAIIEHLPPKYTMYKKSPSKETRSTDTQSRSEQENLLAENSLGGSDDNGDEENDEEDISPTGATTDEPNMRTDTPNDENRFNEFKEPSKEQLDDSNSSLLDNDDDENESEDSVDTTPTDNPTPSPSDVNQDGKRSMDRLYYNNPDMDSQNAYGNLGAKFNDYSLLYRKSYVNHVQDKHNISSRG